MKKPLLRRQKVGGEGVEEWWWRDGMEVKKGKKEKENS